MAHQVLEKPVAGAARAAGQAAAAPQLAGRAAAGPQPAGPQPAGPQSPGSQLAGPQPAGPQSPGSQPADPQPAGPRSAGAQVDTASRRTGGSAARAQAGMPDRRIVRTRNALRTALVQLMEQRGLDAVAVGDLCDAADITRGTFYNHYTGKEDLLRSYEDEVMAGLDVFQERMASLSLAEIALCVGAGKPLPLLVQMFDYLRSEGAFLHAVLGPGGDAAFAPRLRDSVCANLVQSILHERYRESTDPFVGYYVAFFASAYLGVIDRWVATGMNESSEQMARIAQRLLFIKPGESIKL